MSQMQSLGAAEGSARDRQIVAARVILTCPGRNVVTLKIETRSGVYGLGDATLNGRESLTEIALSSVRQDAW
jgi:mannonate dehydratase